MESPEEFVASNDQTQIIKRKRTKRQRSSSPFGLAGAMTSSSSSGCGGIGGERGGGEREVVEDYGSASSPTTSGGEIYESTEEEEDMANCLIMLAQGEGPRQVEHNEKVVESRKFSFLANNTTTTNKAGFFVYECKTCNRSFPSFQALGGHRASHKKPKVTSEEKKVPLKEDFEDGQFMNTNTPPPPPPPLSLQVSSNNKVCQSTNKAKIHECSICGAEFTSGQALGGHMRRHRAATTTTTSNQVGICIDTSTTIESHNDGIKPRNILALDLNLPAPEDDHRGGDTKFQFASTQPPPLVFSAPALVDCHY